MQRGKTIRLRYAGLLLLLSTVPQAGAQTATLAGLTDNWFVTSDSVRLHYLSAGSGPTIVFVPGWTMPADIWELQLRYDATGHVAVQFMRDPRPTVAAGTARQATPQELRAVYDGYYAYFGRYRLSARGDSVAHFIRASLHPEEVGVVYRRAVRVEGGHLFITSQFIDESDRLLHRRFLTFARVR